MINRKRYPGNNIRQHRLFRGDQEPRILLHKPSLEPSLHLLWNYVCERLLGCHADKV